jgi:hypothetical protein
LILSLGIYLLRPTAGVERTPSAAAA